MVIDSVLIYNFVNFDLRIETFFEKDKAAENGGIDYEIYIYRYRYIDI